MDADLEIEISGEEGNYRVAARSATGDAAPVASQFPFDGVALRRQLQALEFALLQSSAEVRRLVPVDEQPVQQFGQRLFEFVFPPDLRAHLLTSYQQAGQRGTPLRLQLRIRPPELASLPWEFLYDPNEEDYLCLSTPLVRYLDIPRARQPLMVTPPLQVLAMIARPGELGPLNADHERRRLTEALESLEAVGQVKLSWVQGQTWWDLQDALDQAAWHIFHFIGHGAFSAEAGEGLLAFAAEGGGVQRLGATDFARLLADHASLRLVVLNSCDGARANATDRFSSTASTLMRRGIPAVVAMQYEITDAAAIAFARGFYRAIAKQLPVDHAVTRARRAIKNTRANTLEWATPVLYLRSPTATLFDLTDAPASTANPLNYTPRPDRQTTSETAPHPPAVASPVAPLNHDDELRDGAFSPDGTRLATAGKDKMVRVWDSVTGAELTRMTHDDWVSAVAFSPDGTRLVTGSKDKTARVWDATTGTELLRMIHDESVYDVAFSPDGARLATGSKDKTARVWDATTGTELARMTHDGSVNTIVFSPDGTRLATGSKDKTARVWDATTGTELARMTHDDWVSAVVFSPNGTLLATAHVGGAARMWDSATGAQLAQLTRENDWVSAVAFSPDGAAVATGSEDKTARLWDTATGAELARMTHDGWVSAVAFSPDGAMIATGSEDRTTRLWDPATGAELTRMNHDDQVWAVLFSPDGTRIATACEDKTAQLWALNQE